MKLIIRANSLFLKAILVISLIVIIAISLRVWLDIRMHGKSIERANREQAKIISEFIEKNVIRAMEKGRHFEIHQILKNFTYRSVWKINVFRLDGTITASTLDEELNKKVNNVELFMTTPNFVRKELVKKESGKREKERIDYLNTPILNHRECFQCHDQKERVIGILSVANSHRELDEEISKVKREAILISLITIGAISSALGLLFLRFINVPIKKLTDTMKKVEKGNLNVKVDVKGRDEMGILADNLNIMIEKLHTAKDEAEQYHQELIKRADRMASIGELASGLAHEIRNPLAGIQGAIQILAEGFAKEDPRKEVTDEIQKQIYKLERLVRDLLNYAKPVPANYLPTDVNQLVDKVLSFFVTQQRRLLDFKIEKKFFSSLPKTMIDPNSMEQAFLNIILNAQKAMPKGGTFTVSTVALPQRNDDGKEVHEVQIIFEDTGVGIPAENLPKIFNPFFSTRSDGTGLGLSITKNIVEQQGGKVEVESQVNAGTKFIITLPVMKQ
jgi:signal transduction histidine kinase